MVSNTTYGLKQLTINIPISAGKTRFDLQQNNELGLPDNATIVALQCRAHDDTITSYDGSLLVKTAVFDNAYLTLKDTVCKNGNINMVLSEFSMTELVNKAFFMEDISTNLIDWNNSYIEVNKRVSADLANDTIIEIVVWYEDDCNPAIENRFNFRDGTLLAGKRVRSFEIQLNATKLKYNLSNIPNIGLPQDAIIIGYSTRANGFPLRADDPQNAASLASTYFTLQVGRNQMIENFPAQISDYKETLFPNLDYIPITPTLCTAFNWQNSNIQISDNTGVTVGMAFQFSLIWYRPS